MSYGSRGPGRPYGVQDAPGAGASQSKQGSVRAARERLLAAREAQQNGPPELRPQPPRDNPLVSQYASMKSPQQSQARGLSPSITSPAEPAARGPSPSQWPLTNDASLAPPKSSAPPINTDRPLRPPRPSNPGIVINPATSFYDNQNPLSPQDASVESRYWQDDEYLSPSAYTSPNPNRPLTVSSQSTNSSLGEIPDFPVPTGTMPPQRRPQNLGPPPSARRGPSSYYSQASYVSPIAEESETRGSMGSFASRGSSNVIPSGVPEFYLEEGEGETPSDDEDAKYTPPRTVPVLEEVPIGIVRQASLGKKSKPTLTTIKSSDSRPDDTMSPRDRMPRGLADYASPRKMSPQSSSLNSGTLLLDHSSASLSSSEESLSKPKMRVGLARTQSEILEDMKARDMDIMSGFPAPQAAKLRNMSDSPPVDPRVDQILGGLEKGGALDPTAPNLRQAPKSQLGERVGQRRPPRLNVDAVRDAEARGSLTSLPDLIRRATRLAANLDRGKTASKLGVDWMWADPNNASREKLSRNASNEKLGRKSEGSLSGILASFPNPGHDTPRTLDGQWPSVPSSQRHINSSGERAGRKKKRNGRRCCGMPLWAFIALIIILIILVAAAVVIPVALIVLPRLHKNSSNSNNQLEICRTTMPCQNGGTEIVQAGDTCGCICANGFTGPRCLNPADAGCSSISVPGQDNATIGSEIPTLLDFAQQYSIPLNTTTLLSLFANTNSSCASENALVTFTGFTKRNSHRRKRPSDTFPLRRDVDEERFAPVIPNLSPEYLNKNKKRDSSATVTSNGVLLDGTATVTPTPVTIDTATSTTTPTTSSQPTGNVGGTGEPGTNSTCVLFARLSILFVFQETTSLDTAVLAQSHIESFLSSAKSSGATVQEAENVGLGFGNASVNLVNLTVTLANGTVYGMGFNGTATSATPSFNTPAASATATGTGGMRRRVAVFR